MRTIYLKNKPMKNHPFYNPYFYKVVEVDKETTETLTVTKTDIAVNIDEEYHHQVAFITDVLCSDSGYEEITRQEFDDFFIKTVGKINEISAL
jgi:hypothetical protein